MDIHEGRLLVLCLSIKLEFEVYILREGQGQNLEKNLGAGARTNNQLKGVSKLTYRTLHFVGVK